VFQCHENTLVEEHISGIPGDVFFRDHLKDARIDEVRLAKEFVKFNERCVLRLLGDMHAGNFVVVVTQDFDETAYRLRAIDFDQQSYEPRVNVYLPQYYKENNPLILLGMKCMTSRTVTQYQEEERTLMRLRARADRDRLEALLDVMAADTLAPIEHVHQLRGELADRHGDDSFRECETMGALVRASLARLDRLGAPLAG
jgi:predicted unusual protein kinase regulating ubiquinone biosynthesis (AarF/ABC1/UbiB family)